MGGEREGFSFFLERIFLCANDAFIDGTLYFISVCVCVLVSVEIRAMSDVSPFTFYLAFQTGFLIKPGAHRVLETGC